MDFKCGAVSMKAKRVLIIGVWCRLWVMIDGVWSFICQEAWWLVILIFGCMTCCSLDYRYWSCIIKWMCNRCTQIHCVNPSATKFLLRCICDCTWWFIIGQCLVLCWSRQGDFLHWLYIMQIVDYNWWL